MLFKIFKTKWVFFVLYNHVKFFCCFEVYAFLPLKRVLQHGDFCFLSKLFDYTFIRTSILAK